MDVPSSRFNGHHPSSNPGTLVLGNRPTLKEANIDLSVTLSDWFGPAQPPVPPSEPPETGFVVVAPITATSRLVPVKSADGGKTWHESS